MLPSMAAPVITEGHRREKPSVYLSPIAQTTSRSPARVSQIQAMRFSLDEDRAAAVDRNDLPRDVRRGGEEVDCLGDVLRRAHARERRGRDDAAALGGIELVVLGPGDGAGRHAVYAHARRQLDRERPRERRKTRLGDAVERIALERALGVNVDDVDDRALVLRELGRGFLADEKR